MTLWETPFKLSHRQSEVVNMVKPRSSLVKPRSNQVKPSSSLVKLTIAAILLLHTVTAKPSPYLTNQPHRAIRSVNENKCNNLEYDTVKGKLLDSYDVFDGLYRLPPFVDSSSLRVIERPENAFFLRNWTQCELLRIQATGEEGGATPTDTCPSETVLNTDVTRVPCVIAEVKCVCRHSIMPESLQALHPSLHCKPVLQHVPVMRKDLTTGQWSQVLEPLAVGCRSATHRVVEEGKRKTPRPKGCKEKKEDAKNKSNGKKKTRKNKGKKLC